MGLTTTVSSMAMAAKSLGGLLPQAPHMPSLAAPPPPPQPAKMPDIQGMVAGLNGAGQAGGAPGPGQTFLAGSGGIDPNALRLNKPTLLGE